VLVVPRALPGSYQSLFGLGKLTPYFDTVARRADE